MGNLLVLFWVMYDSVTRPRDIKSLKILTAYDVWFSRYWPYNLMLATGSALEFKDVACCHWIFGARQVFRGFPKDNTSARPCIAEDGPTGSFLECSGLDGVDEKSV